ncbi:Hypothetical protein A7982_07484 [Minicystis rosea]|nr:Hypothetical protein A7982_07484 [Minicystis rosea]
MSVRGNARAKPIVPWENTHSSHPIDFVAAELRERRSVALAPSIALVQGVAARDVTRAASLHVEAILARGRTTT